MNLEQPFFHPPLEIDPNGEHVAHNLRRGFLVGEKQGALAPRQAVSTSFALMLLLPVPGEPETSTLLPR